MSQQVKQGDTVAVHYTGRLNDGQVFDSSREREPLEFTVGGGQMIAGFDKAVDNMAVGEQKTVEIPAAEAYGERRDDLMFDVPREQVPADITPEVGMKLAINNGDQAMPVIITEVSEEKIVLDANHELAGKNLIFDIELVQVK